MADEEQNENVGENTENEQNLEVTETEEKPEIVSVKEEEKGEDEEKKEGEETKVAETEEIPPVVEEPPPEKKKKGKGKGEKKAKSETAVDKKEKPEKEKGTSKSETKVKEKKEKKKKDKAPKEKEEIKEPQKSESAIESKGDEKKEEGEKPETEEGVEDDEHGERPAKLSIAKESPKKGKKEKKKKGKKAGKKEKSATSIEEEEETEEKKKRKKSRASESGGDERKKSRASTSDDERKKSRVSTSIEDERKKSRVSTTSGDEEKPSAKSKKKGKKRKKGKKKAETEESTEAEGEEKPKKKGKKKGKKEKKKKKSRLELLQAKSLSKMEMSRTDLFQKSLQALRESSKPQLAPSKTEVEAFLEQKQTPQTEAGSSSSTLSGGASEYTYEEIEIEEVAAAEKKKRGKKGKKGKEKKKKGKKKKKEKPSETTESVAESEKPEKKKKGKGKKRKKKEEQEEDKETVVSIEPQVDVLAEIERMKYLAELEASGVEEEETEAEPPKKKKKKKKKKKGPKKKLSKKEKARLAAEAAEKAKLNAEEEAARLAELERIRLEEEKKAAIEKERREGIEQQIRMEQLEGVVDHFKELLGYVKDSRQNAKILSDWEAYVNCGRLPNASLCDQMNTFLHLWENMVKDTSMEEAARRTVDALQLLSELDDLIDTAQPEDEKSVENWKWIRLLFRQQQAKSLDVATYRLLRDIEKNLHRIDIPTADYHYQDDNIALCLWLRVQLPTPLPNPRRPPKPRIEVNFDEMKMEAQFPLHLDGEKMAVRALYVKYDHLSDLSDTYEKPPTPSNYDIDLYEAMKTEWREKLLYKYKNRVKKPPPVVTVEEGEEPPEPQPEPELGPEDEVPIVPYRKLEPTASEYVLSQEENLYSSTRLNLIKQVPDDVINLRKYSIIGGVYALHMIYQPPQPQDFVTLEMTLTPLYLPKELEFVDLYLDYEPPAPPEPGVRRLPEEIEEDMKKQEEEFERLILVTLTWPEHVIFLELPMVCYWDQETKAWSKSEVHDLKHNEEKSQLTFRTRKCGVFALAVYRYSNLPYQAWEMRPEADGSITLQITAAILLVEFNVKDGVIALTQLQNSPNNALQDTIGVYTQLPKMIRMLQSAGVDVFPAFDAFCYVENTCEKHWPMEKHLYFNMAQMSICFNFAWSRWNISAGRRSVVMQMREYSVEKTKQKSHQMALVTPLSAIYVDCTEVSQTFNEEGVENMKFFPDLYHLMKGTTNMAIKNKISKAPKETVFALYELLIATRVVSFS